MARVLASLLSLSASSDSVDDSSFSRPESSAGSRSASLGALRVADGAISGASGQLAGALSSGGTNSGASWRSRDATCGERGLGYRVRREDALRPRGDKDIARAGGVKSARTRTAGVLPVATSESAASEVSGKMLPRPT
jgi:hypothetical protein